MPPTGGQEPHEARPIDPVAPADAPCIEAVRTRKVRALHAGHDGHFDRRQTQDTRATRHIEGPTNSLTLEEVKRHRLSPPNLCGS